MLVVLSLLLVVSSALQEGNANSTDECSLLQDVHRDENRVTDLLQLTLLKEIVNQSPQAKKLLETTIKKLGGEYPISTLVRKLKQTGRTIPQAITL